MIGAAGSLVAAGLLLGMIAGFVMHRSDFCMAGAFRDLFLFGSLTMLRPVLLMSAAAMVLFEAGRLCGLVSLSPFPLFEIPSASNLAGGAIFGLGMVLAGGCVVGTLYRVGAGNVAAMVTLAGLVAGSGLYAEIHPAWKRLADATAMPALGTTVPAYLRIESYWLTVPLATGAALVFLRWRRQGRLTRQAQVEGYLQPWLTALVLAGVSLLSVMATTMPLGVTTSYTKAGVWLLDRLAPGHLAELSYVRTLPLNLAATTPLGGIPLIGGPAPVMDAITLVQVPVIAGIIAGSALSALLLGEFGLRYRIPARQYLAALAGGILMGLAARMAPSCNIWHLAGGLPILAWQSIIFTAGLLAGAWLGSRAIARCLA